MKSATWLIAAVCGAGTLLAGTAAVQAQTYHFGEDQSAVSTVPPPRHRPPPPRRHRPPPPPPHRHRPPHHGD